MDNYNFEDDVNNLYTEIIFNWSQIREYEEVMNVLDMETNTLCVKLKENNPMLRDEFVQARVLTILLVMFIMVSSFVIIDGDNNHNVGDIL